MTATLSIIILVICVILFITELIPSSFTAVLGCVLMYAVGACDFSSAFSGFSNSAFFLVAGSMIVGVAMAETGVAQLVANYCIKLSKGKEKLFILYAAIASGILSAFIANTAVVACFLPIIESVALSGGGTRKNMTMAITFGAMYGGSLTLVGSTPQPIANGILQEMTGLEAKMFDYLGPGLCIFVAFILYTQLFGYEHGKRVWGNRPEEKAMVSKENLEDLNVPVSKFKVAAMAGIFILMIVSYSFQLVPTEMTAIIAGLLCIVLRLCTEKQVFQGIAWSPLIMLAGTIGIAAGLNNSGAGKILIDFIMSIIGDGASPYLVFTVFVLGTTIISNFCANAATTIIVLPLAISACLSYGWNPITFAVGIVIAANLACATPIAHTQVTMTLVAGYRFSDYIKYNGLMCIIANTLIILTTPLFLPF